MFYFGDPADIAQMYINEALAEDGPSVPEGALEDLELQVMADPAETRILVLPSGPGVPLDLDSAAPAITRVQLQDAVLEDRNCWQLLDGAVAIPRGVKAT